MSGLSRMRVLTVLATLLGGRAGVLAADGVEELTKKAVELRRVGDDQGAYPLLREAYDLSHSPRAAAQWGFCEQALGRWAEAEVHLSESLRGASDPWVQKNRLAIEQSLTTVKSHIARLEIAGEPAGAEVLVNGNLVGQLPLAAPVRATAGEIEIELRAAGYQRATKSLRVDGGQYQKVIIRAERHTTTAAAGPGAAAPSPTSPATSAGAGGAPAGPAGTPAGGPSPGVVVGGADPHPATSSGWRPYAKWVSWGVGAVALGVGVYGVTHNRSLVADFDRGCGIDPQTGPYALVGSGRTDAACSSRKTDYESASRLGAIGLVASGILAVAGVVLFVTEPRATAAADTGLVAWSCSPDLGATGAPALSCSARW